MAGSINKVILIGHIGQDPDVRTFQSGDKVASFSLATSESWKDKASGERKERTEWHKIVVFNQGLIKLCESYLTKGSKVYVEGQLETRNYDKDGVKHYTTEIVLRPYNGQITMLDGRKDSDGQTSHDQSKANGYQPQPKSDWVEDDIPF